MDLVPTYRIEGVTYFSGPDAERYCSAQAWIWRTAGQALQDSARRAPDKAALVGSDGERVSFARFDEVSDRLAAALLRLGLQPGDRAMFQMGTVPDTAIALFGCFKAGIIPVCTLPQHRELEIGALAGLTGAKAHFVQANASSFDLVSFGFEMGRKCASLQHLIVAGGEAPAGTHGLHELAFSITHEDARLALSHLRISPADVMLFQTSGGTTGVPKVIPRMHAEYLGYAAAWSHLLGIGHEDAALWALPLIHNAAMIYHLVPCVLQARTLVLLPRFEPLQFFGVIEREKIAVSGSIGPIAARILDYADIGRHDLSSLKIFTTLSRADAIERHLGVSTINVFGITEGILTGCPPDAPVAARHTTIGKPASPLDELRLLKPASEQEVEEGAEGELAFRGPSTLRGYYGAPDLNRAAFTSDGFFRTGDLMRAQRIDNELCYVFAGRTKDNIDRGGEKFGAEEVENLIVRHPAVWDVKVVAMPDRVYGEKACAFLVLAPEREAPDIESLGRFLLAEGIAKFKLPERVEVVENFPVTRVGKVDKAALRALIAAKLQSEENG
jgi:pyochelin biosynthesis protein PchD